MDKNLQDNIDDIFKDPLQSFHEQPERNVWENIERELNKDRQRVFFYLFRNRAVRLVAACLACAGIAMGVLTHSSQASHHLQSPRRATLLPETRQDPAAVAVEPVKYPAASSLQASIATSIISPSRDEVDALGALHPTLPAPTMQGATPMANIRCSGLIQLKAESSTETLANAPVPVNRVNLIKMLPTIYLTEGVKRWSLTGYFAQELAGYNLADHDSTAANGRKIDKKETSLFSASGGVLVGYRLSRKWIIQSGLIYSWSRSISDPSVAYAVTDNNGNTKYKLNTPTGYGFLPASSPIGDSAETDQPSSRLHYLSVPLIASYTFDVSRRFMVLTGAGVIGNLLTSATVASKIQGPSSPQAESIVTLYGLRKINYGLFLKAEIRYAIRRDWSVNLTLTSKNSLTPINTNMTYSTFPYYAGLGIGMTRRF